MKVILEIEENELTKEQFLTFIDVILAHNFVKEWEGLNDVFTAKEFSFKEEQEKEENKTKGIKIVSVKEVTADSLDKAFLEEKEEDGR